MRIGIVMPAFNVAPYIGDAILSVLAQTHSDWAMAIVDDGSTDATAAVAAGFAYPGVRLLRQVNAGVSVARNRGLAATDAEAVLFLDADDWLAADALAALAQALEANPAAVAAVGAYVKVPGGHRIRHPESGDLLRPLLIHNRFVNGGHLLIRRAALEAAGPFRAGLRYGEDWELWTRLARLGPFAAARFRGPLLYARERPDGAYMSMATRPESFTPCMDAIFRSPDLLDRLGTSELTRLRRRAEAENEWIIGRALIRRGNMAEGGRFLRRSVRAAPSLRRLALLAASVLRHPGSGPFRSWAAPDPA